MLIKDPVELMNALRKDKLVKIVDSKPKCRTDCILYDYSIDMGGHDEDLQYIYNQFYRHNIRRGNTIIQILAQDNTVHKTMVARQGQFKSLDICREYLLWNLGKVKKLPKFGVYTNEQHEKVMRLLFDSVEAKMEEGVKVIAMEKVNGENAQVSYVEAAGAWIICSKNVSVLAERRGDIKWYNGKRFGFAKKIAEAWFDQLEAFRSAESVESLKKDLTNRTMVGEFIGDQSCQHLVKYAEKEIRWFAVVEHGQDEMCLASERAVAFLEHYGFPHARLSELGTYHDWGQLNARLLEYYDYVSGSDIEREGEGCILYLESAQKVLSLGKLKTLEYRIYRKLREKLRSFLHPDDAPRDYQHYYNNFKRQVKELCDAVKPARQFSYYFDVADEAFYFADRYYHQPGLVLDEFITFLSVIMYYMDHPAKKYSAEDFTDKNKWQFLSIPWSTYQPSTFLNRTAPLPPTASAKQKTVIAIVPIGIPGMGKSTYVSHLSSLYDVAVISMDEIRAKHINRIRNKTHEQKMEITRDSANKEYDEAIRDAINNHHSDTLILFLDKNHPPNGINKAIETLKKSTPYTYKLVVTALVPECASTFSFPVKKSKQVVQFPFSFTFMVNCIHRVQSRKTHPTLPGNDIQSLQVMFKFITMFENFKMSKDALKTQGFNYVLSFPFVEDSIDDDRNFDSDFVYDFEDIVEYSGPDKKCSDKKLMFDFLDALKEIKLKKGEDNSKLISKNIEHTFNKLLKQYSLTAQKPQEQKKVESIEEPKNNEKQEDQKKSVEKAVKKRGGYNPAKIPEYLGIFLKDRKEGQRAINTWIIKCLKAGKAFYRNSVDLEILYKKLNSQLFEYGDRFYENPENWHVTLLYIGNQKDNVRNESAFKNFDENSEHKVRMSTLIVCVDGLICGLVNKPTLECLNAYPHMTLYTKQLKPKQSNDVIAECFKNSELKRNYNDWLSGKPLAEKVTKENIRLGGKNYECFVITLDEEVEVDAVAQGHFLRG